MAKVEEILDLMDEMIDKASSVPFTNKKVIDIEKMREYIDSIRYNLPTDIKKAKELQNDQAIIMTEANKKAEVIIKKAEERAQVLVSQDEITKAAQIQAADILNQAYAADKEIRNAMAKKLETALTEAEEVLTRNLVDVKQTKEAIIAVAEPKQPIGQEN
ncbi:MAG: ATPase [Ruminococcus sp.]|nr:ATPase [Ruminococcus sp.]